MKKILVILILMFGAFFVGRFFDTIKRQIKRLEFKPDTRLIIIVAVAFLFLGIFIGKGANFVKNIARKATQIESKVKADKILVLTDFESINDFKKWETRKSSFEQASDYATEGKYSGEMVFFGGVKCSNVLMEDFLEENPRYGNWANFKELRFDIYNTSDNTERLVLKIKDANGKSWQRNISLPPEQNSKTKIYIEELKDRMNASRIRQFNFFRWEPKKEVTFYIDNIRLVPFGAEEQTAQLQKARQANSKAGGNSKFFFDAQNGDFGVGVETSAEKVFLKPNKFKGKASDTVEISLARNEYESAQLVIYAKESLEKVKIEKNDLIAHINGKEVKISKDNIKCFIVGYVKTRKPGYSVSHVGWWPDPLEEKTSFHVRKKTLQPVWIEVYAPEHIPSGEYSGDIAIKFEDSKSKNIKLKVKVWDFSLPKETHLKTAFDFYNGRLMRMYPKKRGEGSQDYKRRISELKTQYYLDMIKHRIMPIFNFDIKDAFFVKDIRPYLNSGLSTFAIGKYSGSHGNNWPKDPERLNGLIEVYRDYAKILKAGKVIDKAYIYTYDEPKYGDSRVNEITRMIHKADPELKNMVCLHDLANPDKYPGWGDDIDIWCVRNVVFNEKMAKVYTDRGKEIWIYVSGPAPPYPTLVIDYPAMAYRIIPWMCWKYGIEGYLYWCVNFWDKNPWQNPMNTKWEQNGNGSLYYPGEKGPVTSIRLEVTRDGLEDYEYLYLLNQKIKSVKDKNLEESNQDLVNKSMGLVEIDESIASSMADYTRNPELIYKRRQAIAEAIEALDKLLVEEEIQVVEDFSKPVEAISGKSFGDHGQFTFELYRGGTFTIDGKSGFAWQKSSSYRDVAIIRSTNALPKTYTVRAIVGDIDYDLSNIEGLRPDTEYEEGPMNENGCYLLAITDEPPVGHHTNDWWHQHRKVCIDVDNNIWGSGMPNPIFMVYFDKNNKLVTFDGKIGRWQSKWQKAVTYEPKGWYKIEIKKTESKFILSVYDENGSLLRHAEVDSAKVWHEDGDRPDYLVIGDPHENYYQGSMKIKSISIWRGVNEKEIASAQATQ